MPFFTNLEILTGLRTLGPRYNRVNHINLKIWTFSWWTLCRMMALQVLQNVTQCGPNWHNVTTCRMLALFNLVTTYLVWLRQLTVRWVGPISARRRWFSKEPKGRMQDTLLKFTVCRQLGTGPTVTWMFEPSYCKVQRCHVWLCKVRLLHQKIASKFLWKHPSIPMLPQEDARAVVSDGPEV